MQVWRPHVRTWGLPKAHVLYRRQYLWYCWEFSAPSAVIWRPGNCVPPLHYAPGILASKGLSSRCDALAWLAVESCGVLVQSALKKLNFPVLLRVPSRSSVQCQHVVSNISCCLQDWKCVKYTTLVYLWNKLQSIHLRTSLQWLTTIERQISASLNRCKRMKAGQAGSYLTSILLSWNMFYNWCVICFSQVGNHVNIASGKWTANDAGVGAGVDSFYEYLVKGAILLDMPVLMDMFRGEPS